MSDAREVKVWDLAVRLFHWILVAGFFFTYFAEGDWLTYHIWVGYGILALLSFRFVWGFIGPRTARFSDFVRGPITVLRYLRSVLTFDSERYLGHNPAGGAMIVALLLCVLSTACTGILLYGADAWLGPMAWLMKDTSEDGIAMLETAHELLANLSVVLIVIHVGGVVWESVAHRENLVGSMITGRKAVHAGHVEQKSTASPENR